MHSIAKISRVLLAGTAALALAGPASVGQNMQGLNFIQPAAAAGVEINFFYDRLSPHGSWINHRRHGYVFVPAVGEGWRPYTRGHWVYTDAYGWYWESEEPFAWAAYHYGRWGYSPAFGWYWVPGNVWGPAWVSWRHGGGNVGWAPIGPEGDGYVYGTPDYYEPPVVEAWVFVPERRFVAQDISRYVAPVVEINLFLGKARERHHVRYRDGRAYNPFLPRERVTKIVNKEVNIYNITNVNEPEQASRRGRKGQDGRETIQAFRADISDTKPKEKPKRIANTPEEIKQRPRLKERAKGKRPEGSAPSIAELKPDEGARGDGKAKPENTAEEKQPAPDGKTKDRARRDGDGDRKAGEKQQTDDGKARNARRKDGEGGKAEGKAKPDTKAKRQDDAKKDAKEDAKPQAKAAPKEAKPDAPEKAEPKAEAKQPQPPKEAKPKAESGKEKRGAARQDAQPDQPKREKPKQAGPEGKRQAPPQARAKEAPEAPRQGKPKQTPGAPPQAEAPAQKPQARQQKRAPRPKSNAPQGSGDGQGRGPGGPGEGKPN